jgi:hypothetical protein
MTLIVILYLRCRIERLSELKLEPLERLDCASATVGDIVWA